MVKHHIVVLAIFVGLTRESVDGRPTAMFPFFSILSPSTRQKNGEATVWHYFNQLWVLKLHSPRVVGASSTDYPGDSLDNSAIEIYIYGCNIWPLVFEGVPVRDYPPIQWKGGFPGHTHEK